MTACRNTKSHSKSRQVLFVHQGAELYGSDRSFERSVRGFRRAVPESHITVLLATHGPLVELLRPHIDEIIITPLFVLRKHLLKKGELFNIPAQLGAIKKAMRVIDNYDAVYINTTVILDYIIACRLKKIPFIIHVRELPVGFIRTVLQMIVRLSGATVIFNSQATRIAFGVQEDSRHLVIANGTLIGNYEPLRMDDTLRILLIGRFNSWKGQGLLVTALARLEASLQKKIRVVMVGGVYRDQYYFKDDVIQQTREAGLEESVEFREFVEDPTELYHWSSVVVVPSLLPEPFGLVAIEAMGHGRPVIAADHGGLVDIVVDGKTGLRFCPGNPEALAVAIRTYLEQPDLVNAHGIEGRKRYEKYYHEEHYMTAVSEAIKAVIQS